MRTLGDLGANVIKVERPGQGDETRAWGPPFSGDLSAYYLSCNRNKRAITLDLARKEGLELFHALVKRCDVLLENFKASRAQKMGLTPQKLLDVNPRLIVCSISGFGRSGPLSDLPGYDFAWANLQIDARQRVNAIIPPLALDGPSLSIRRFGTGPVVAEALVELKSLSPEMLQVLAAAVKSRISILISGGTGAGGGRCAGSQAISRSISSIVSVSEARYCFDQRST